MKKILYIVYVPLLLIEWLVDLIGNIWKTFHESIKSITLATENLLNEPVKPKD